MTITELEELSNNWITLDKYNKIAKLSPSMLSREPRQIILSRMYPDQRDKATILGFSTALGTACHDRYEELLKDDPSYITEQSFKTELNGIEIGGTIDAYHMPTKHLIDFKFVTGASMTEIVSKKQKYEDYRLQMNAYKLIMEANGLPVESMTLMVHNINHTVRSKTRRIEYVDVEPISREEMIEFITEKNKVFDMEIDDVPQCRECEKWGKTYCDYVTKCSFGYKDVKIF